MQTQSDLLNAEYYFTNGVSNEIIINDHAALVLRLQPDAMFCGIVFEFSEECRDCLTVENIQVKQYAQMYIGSPCKLLNANYVFANTIHGKEITMLVCRVNELITLRIRNRSDKRITCKIKLRGFCPFIKQD